MSARVWQLERMRARFSGHERALREVPSAQALVAAICAQRTGIAPSTPPATHLRLALNAPVCDPFAVARALAATFEQRPHLAEVDGTTRWAAGAPLLRLAEEQAGAAAASALANRLQAAREKTLWLAPAGAGASVCCVPWALLGVSFQAATVEQHNDFLALGGAQALVPSWLVASGPDGATVVVHSALPALGAEGGALFEWARGVVETLDALVVAARAAPPPTQSVDASAREALAALINPPEHRWAERIEKALAELARPDATLKKLVLAERFVSPRPRLHTGDAKPSGVGQLLDDTCAVLEHLGAQGDHAMRFAWPLSAPAAYFLGATPELLAKVDDGQLKTHAVAGTRAIDGDVHAAARALEGDEKERREHAWVVAGLLSDLAPLCTGPLRLGRTRAERFGKLLHLVTPVTGALRDDVDACAVLGVLHPTPALGGHPREAACAYIAASEPFARGLYGAPLGWLMPGGDGAFYVGIRSALLKEDEAILFAGAGIVQGSLAAREWQELLLKLAPMRRALALLG